MLEKIGVTPAQEAVYEALLRSPGATVRELAVRAGRSAAAVRSALDALARAGLVLRSSGQPPRFNPVSPVLGVETLVRKREEELQQIRLRAAELAELYHTATLQRGPEQLVELLIGRDAVGRQFLEMLRTAQEEVLILDRPPYVLGAPQVEPALMPLSRGVPTKVIYAPESLDVPEKHDLLRRWVEAGEQARVHPRFVMKLVITDRRAALMPLTRHPEDGSVLLHHSQLLDALLLLFEKLWAEATPLGDLPARTVTTAAPDAADDRLLTLMVGGAKDEAIARQLNVSPRTVRRWIAELLDGLPANTRFQAGYVLGTRLHRLTWQDDVRGE